MGNGGMGAVNVKRPSEGEGGKEKSPRKLPRP